MQVSPVIRIVAIVGVLAILALGAGMFFMSRSAAAAEASLTEPLPNVMRKGSATAAKKPAKRVPASANLAAASKEPAKATPPAVRKPQPRPVAKPAPKPKVVLNEGLAPAIAAALSRSEVVVVALYAPDAKVDRISAGESQAGARDARVGFVALNVLDQAQGGALTAELGMLDAPAVLVYKRPGTIVVHLEGFADRETVAQAAASARA